MSLMESMLLTAAKAEWAVVWPEISWDDTDEATRTEWARATAAGLDALLPHFNRLAQLAFEKGWTEAITAADHALHIEYAVEHTYEDADDHETILITSKSVGYEISLEKAEIIASEVANGRVVARRVSGWVTK